MISPMCSGFGSEDHRECTGTYKIFRLGTTLFNQVKDLYDYELKKCDCECHKPRRINA